jgi:hypothetical protein
MRIWKIFGLVCAALALAGCESDQPLDASSVGGGSGNATVNIQGSASVPVWNVWSWTEDLNGNGLLDVERDLDNDGRLDSGEDINHNLALDPGEDRNGNGRIDFTEDCLAENGALDKNPFSTGQCPQCEDDNGNCILDAGEDDNFDGLLQTEDFDCDNRLDGNEDTNRNGVRDFEDFVESNSSLDAGIWCEETGLPAVTGPVPLPVAGQVLLYHPNNPTPVVLANLGTSGGSSFTGLTPYDNRVFGTMPGKSVPLINGFQLQVAQGQQLSAGSTRVMLAVKSKSPAHDIGNGPTNDGLCNVGFDFGQPNLGVPLPIVAQVGPGDLFSIRLQSPQPGTFSEIEGAGGYALSGSVVKDGVILPTSGTAAAPPGLPVTFSVSVP